MTEAAVPESLWNVPTYVVHDPYWGFAGFLLYDPGVNGYDIMPTLSGLRPLVIGKTLEEAIATLTAFEYPVTAIEDSLHYTGGDRP